MIDSNCIDLSNFEVKEIISSDSFYSDVVINDKQYKENYFGRIFKNKNEKLNITQNINILPKLNHPNILKLIGYSQFDFDHQNNPILITKYYKNGTLKSIFELQKKNMQPSSLDITCKLKILYGIATGMAYLHSHKIIHCNLNLSSILLDDDYNPIISNFNCAVFLGQSPVNAPIKSFYTAPEVLRYNEYARESDVYSFAFIMYQLLTDQIPFESTANEDKDDFQLNFSSVQLAKPYQNLIEKCCSKDPQNRPTFDHISYVLKSVKEFMIKGVNEKDFHQYIEKIKSSKIEYYDQFIQIDSNEINKHISTELKQQFEKDPDKIKYFIIQEAKKLIYELALYYEINKKLKVKFDVNKIDEVLIQKFQELAKTKNNDAATIEVSSNIKEIIDEKYNMIHKHYSLSLNYKIIDKIILFLWYCGDNQKDEIQKKINNFFCKHYQNDFLFNHDKLRGIHSTKTDLKDIKDTLRAISKLFYTESSYHYRKNLKFISIYPIIKSEYPKTLSSILTGNCFIITLFGNIKCTHKVVSTLLLEDYPHLKKYQNFTGISIFGPVDFKSLAIQNPNSFTFLKNYNEDFPNIFFFEISNQVIEKDFEDYCNFILYISHFAIFCSDSDNKDSEIDTFQKLILSSHFDGSLINCSTKMPINLTQTTKFSADFDIMNLEKNHLQNYLIKEIDQNRIKFIPSEAIIEFSKLILQNNINTILNQDKTNFQQLIMEQYSNKIFNKSKEYFKQLVKTGDLKITDLMNILLDKTRTFFYTNIYTDFWNNEQIEKAYNAMILECTNDFKSLISHNKYSFYEENRTKSIDEIIKDDFHIFIKENPLLSSEDYGKYVYYYYYQHLQNCKTFDLTSLATEIRSTSIEYLPVLIDISIDYESFSNANIKIRDQSKKLFIFSKTSCNGLFKLAKKEFNLQSIPFHIINRSNKKQILNDSTCLYQLDSYYYRYRIFYGVYAESVGDQKKIKIADDFHIDANNNDAGFIVTYPPNHKGWIDVEFDIKMIQKSNNECKDDLIIFLQLDNKDSSYILEGNSVELQYYDKNKWVTQKDEVLISFPKCDSAIFPLHHCSKYKISKKDIKIQKDFIRNKIKAEYINDKYSRNWNYFDPNRAYLKGGQPYYLPVGFESYGIKRDKWDKNTCVAFYGITLKNINEINDIIKDGFKLPSDKNADKAIFVTPSVKYAALKAISKTLTFRGNVYVQSGCFVKSEEIQEYCYALVLLQVRVKPDSYETCPYKTNFFPNDPHFSHKTIEWKITNPRNVYPYRILFKFIRCNEFMVNYIEKIQDTTKKLEHLSLEIIKDLLKSKRLVGEGSSSNVYRVNNIDKDIFKTDKKYLAMKMFHFDLDSRRVRRNPFSEEESDNENTNKERFKRIMAEVILVNSLNHKNIAKFYGYCYGDENIRPLIILEYCQNNLKECIKFLEDKYIVSVIFEVCTVMSCLHEHKIIFCDLKPENILISNERHVKLCDFGGAKDTEDIYTSLSNNVGTPIFMAPEMRQLDYQYDEKVDVYSFGVLMYFILTKGEYPKSEILEKEKLPSKINKLSQKIIRSCWSYLPEKRPSFKEIRQMIVDNFYLLINGIEKQVPEIIKFLELVYEPDENEKK